MAAPLVPLLDGGGADAGLAGAGVAGAAGAAKLARIRIMRITVYTQSPSQFLYDKHG